MKNVIYCRTTVPAGQSPDGETPTQILVTEEVNLYCIWEFSHDGTKLLDSLWGGNCREFALETAVYRAAGRCPGCGADSDGCYCAEDSDG